MSENCETEKEVEKEQGEQQSNLEGSEDNVESLDAKREDITEDNETAETVEEKKEEDFKAKFYYLAAELENSRKRFEREREKFVKYGNERILKALLDVVDNLGRTVESVKSDEDEKIKNIASGIGMVHEQFLKVLTDNGLEKVDSLGKIFDPNFHEAMAQQPAEGKEDDEIVQVYQDGYKLNGRLLRAAKVIIAKK